MSSNITIFNSIKVGLFGVIDSLEVAREIEAKANGVVIVKKNIVSDLEYQIATHEKRLIANAYAEDVIDGKNAETRKSQESSILADDHHLKTLNDQLSKENREYAEAITKAEVAKARRYNEQDRASAWKALCDGFKFEVRDSE